MNLIYDEFNFSRYIIRYGLRKLTNSSQYLWYVEGITGDVKRIKFYIKQLDAVNEFNYNKNEVEKKVLNEIKTST